MKRIGIIGAGGFAREVLWLLGDLGLAPRVGAFFESDAVWLERDVAGLPVLPLSRLDPSRWEAVIAIGNPQARRAIRSALPRETSFPTFIHPSVLRSSSVEIGAGTVICAGSILTCNIHIDEQVHLNLATTVGHDTRLHPFVTTAPAVNISGGCDIGQLCYIGTNACLREGLTIAPETVIGMGAVVVSHLREPGVYMGSPAKRRANP